MKNIIFILLLCTGMVQAQIINIPDANFKAKLLSANSSNYIASTQTPDIDGGVITYNQIDTNNDGEIQQSEAISIKFLNVVNASIGSLSGIEGFMNLITLYCSSNQLTSLDVSNNLNLSYLDCSSNQLTTLNLTSNLNLINLRCHYNQLSSLNVSGLTNLKYLLCAENQFTNLDFSSLTAITFLAIFNNNSLTSLNIKNGVIQVVNSAIGEGFMGCPNLQFICVDEGEFQNVVQGINQLGLATTCNVNTYCSFNPGGNYNTITGTNKYDIDEDGCDVADSIFEYLKYNINDGINQGATFSNNLGVYKFYTQAGTFTVTPQLENPTYFITNPVNATETFTNNNNNVATHNFCIEPNGINPDLEVVLVPIEQARPGFNAVYKIIYKNKGNQVANGQVTLTFDDTRMTFLNASEIPTVTTGMLTFNYSNLLPFQNRVITINFYVNSPTVTPPVNIGDILPFTATINPVVGDVLPNDNTFSFNQTVVGSYDPNNIECLEGETVSPSLIGEYLHYVINFENLGTYNAENVVVKCVIDDTKYDINTLQLLNTSHQGYTRLTGNEIEFIFEDINLDAAAGNPPVGGHGNVLFKIKSKSNLTTNDFVSKKANIYFDYNFPIATNMETTTFVALNNSIFTIDESVSVFPNPTNSIVHIESKYTINSIELYDVQGRVLQMVLENDMTSKIDITTKAKGIYFLKINTDYGSKVAKIMKD